MKKSVSPKTGVLGLLLILLSFCSVLYFYFPIGSKKKIFRECVIHKDFSKTHTHAMLKILQDGKTIKIPSNLGITSRCMHPLHTHDETGLIHMEYPRNVKYTLGDFFDLMGVVLKDDQVGSLRVLDDYSITIMKNNQKITHGYYKILLKDHDKITITIISP